MNASPAVVPVAKPLSESAASEVMWVYYRDQKAQLVSDAREYRDFIHTQIVSGIPVEQVFAQFSRPPEPIPKPGRTKK